MSESAVKIYARVCPARATRLMPAPHSTTKEASHTSTPTSLSFTQKRSMETINNQKQLHNFKFDRVFASDCGQEEIFDGVREVIDGCLLGYNGTIFAYGQTGSGKTFTITGGPKSYQDRGIIPRAIQHIFSKTTDTTDQAHIIHISYLEIYNEVGYDLLDTSRDAKLLDDLPKVYIQEDAQERMHIKNLSMHVCTSQEQALDLLFQGDTTKIISSTPSNPASSRSHCLFILTLSTTTLSTSVTRRSKLHLVDLAGSERVGRTGIGGTLLREARYINLSLHYLEQVIVALGESKGGHVPYRNSLMTSLMRDSLGGNCRTLMLATVSTEDALIEESIATCRFAQRVAMIKNTLTLTEEVDPFLTIERLKKEIERLKAELSLAGLGSDDPLPEYELARVRDTVMNYLKTGGEIVFGDMRKIRYAFEVLREYAGKHGERREGGNNPVSVDAKVGDDKLIKTLAQRDNEIVILLQKLKGATLIPIPSPSAPTPLITNTQQNPRLKEIMPGRRGQQIEVVSDDFPAYQLSHVLFKLVVSQKQGLAEKYTIAKSTGERAHFLRSEIEQNPPESVLPQIHEYKSTLILLKTLKSEIEHLQRSYTQTKLKIRMDFDVRDDQPHTQEISLSRDGDGDVKQGYDERRYLEVDVGVGDDAFTRFRKEPHREAQLVIPTPHPIHTQVISTDRPVAQSQHEEYTKPSHIIQQRTLLPSTTKKDIRAEIKAFYEARDRILNMQ